MEPELADRCLRHCLETMGQRPLDWVLIPHHWPIETDSHYKAIQDTADYLGARVINPEKNLGGTGGANFAISHLNPGPEDLVLWLDGDSWPIESGWLSAMIDVMRADPKIATLSLHPGDWPAGDPWYRPDDERMVDGHRIWHFNHPQAFSVTLWRSTFAKPEIEAEFKWYGQIEAPTYRKSERMGLKNAWLADFNEKDMTPHHNPTYEAWKNAHVSRQFGGNFDEFLKALESRQTPAEGQERQRDRLP